MTATCSDASIVVLQMIILWKVLLNILKVVVIIVSEERTLFGDGLLLKILLGRLRLRLRILSLVLALAPSQTRLFLPLHLFELF
jgi:hypothetical protein